MKSYTKHLELAFYIQIAITDAGASRASWMNATNAERVTGYRKGGIGPVGRCRRRPFPSSSYGFPNSQTTTPGSPTQAARLASGRRSEATVTADSFVSGSS